MPNVGSIPLPAAHALQKLGRDLALARRKRGISTSDMAARLFVGRNTLWRLERGDPTVALGTMVTATFILNLHDRLANLASPAADEIALSLDEQSTARRFRSNTPPIGCNAPMPLRSIRARFLCNEAFNTPKRFLERYRTADLIAGVGF